MKMFGGCNHSCGFVAVVFEKISATITAVKTMVCPMCKTQINTGLRLEPQPQKPPEELTGPKPLGVV